MTNPGRLTAVIVLSALAALHVNAREGRDTLFSSGEDRIIVDYTVQQSGGKTTVTFNGVQKKLGTESQRRYKKKLEEVKVVIFDRTGTYGETKFEGLTPTAFMVPSGASYNYSPDGFFILQDNPRLEFSGDGGMQLQFPIFLAHYEKKHHYKVFSQCGTLAINADGGKGGSPATARSKAGESRHEEVIASEELLDEGLPPAEEALIRISNMRNMLDMATKVPFSEELTHEYAALSDLRMKIADAAVGQQVDDALRAYVARRQELEAKGEAAEELKKEEARQEAAAMQARQDSIQAAAEAKADEKQKDMMWLIGGIAGLGLLVMGGKQIWQSVKNNKMQRMMMENINKAQQQAAAQVNIPGLDSNPLTRGINQDLQRQAGRTLTKEGEEAKKRLQALRKGNTPGGQSGLTGKEGNTSSPAPAVSKPKKPSLNDAIPARYKRWRKPGASDSNNNVTI